MPAFTQNPWFNLAITGAALLGFSSFRSPSYAGTKDALEGPQEYPVVATELPPYAELNGKEPSGVMIELVQAMAKKVGHSGKIDLISWNRAQKATTTNPDGIPRLILPLIRTAEREKKYQWVVPLMEDDAIIVTLKGKRPAITAKAQLAGLRVGVLDGSPLQPWLLSEKQVEIDPAPSQDVNAKKLYAGRIDAWFVVRMVGRFEFKSAGFDPNLLNEGISLRPLVLYLAASPNFPKTQIKAWQKAFESIKKDGTFKKIVARYDLTKK